VLDGDPFVLWIGQQHAAFDKRVEKFPKDQVVEEVKGRQEGRAQAA
jgi:hypothetical protein